MSDNPLLRPSTLPYQLPPFALLRDEHFPPAFELGMAEQIAEIATIASNPEPASFENTVVAYDQSGALLSRAERAFGILTGAWTNPELQRIEADFAPKFAAHRDAIHLHSDLFARLQSVYERRAGLGLDPESLRLVERYHKDFVLAGAALSAEQKLELKALNSELATLSTQFSQNVLNEINASAVIVDSRDELAGLPDAAVEAAAAAATAAGETGKFALRLTNTTGQPPLNQLTFRPTRERITAASLARGSRGGDYDNRGVVASIAAKRAQRARLLGFASHAELRLQDQTAATVEAVNGILARLAPRAVANAEREAAELQELIDADGGGFALAACDWQLYSERLRQSRYAFDESLLKPYYELRRVLIDGVFHAATLLYGITFVERPELQGYSSDMLIFEVFDHDGSALGLFLGDYYARPNKRGGAWMNAYVPQCGLTGDRPVIGNHLNIPKPPEGEPTLLTHDEVSTMFHEFGHALHGFFSDVRYVRFSGTSVPRDFVEYPSQVNEMWQTWPEVLSNYARHYETNEPMPADLLEKVLVGEAFNEGMRTTELLAAAILDQAWHQLAPEDVPTDVLAFEALALAKNGVDFAPVPPRYRSTYFSHVFSGGYSAGYYSYIWSEVLDADSVEWFKDNGGLTRANGDHFRSTLLSRGGSVDAMDLFRAFRGADPNIEPLLKRRGLE